MYVCDSYCTFVASFFRSSFLSCFHSCFLSFLRGSAHRGLNDRLRPSKFASVWESESGKYGDVLKADDAQSRITDAIDTIRVGYEAKGKDVPDDTALFEKAVSMELRMRIVF